MAKFSKAQYEIITGALNRAFFRLKAVYEYNGEEFKDFDFGVVTDEIAKALTADNRRFNPVEFRLNVKK